MNQLKTLILVSFFALISLPLHAKEANLYYFFLSPTAGSLSNQVQKGLYEDENLRVIYQISDMGFYMPENKGGIDVPGLNILISNKTTNEILIDCSKIRLLLNGQQRTLLGETDPLAFRQIKIQPNTSCNLFADSDTEQALSYGSGFIELFKQGDEQILPDIRFYKNSLLKSQRPWCLAYRRGDVQADEGADYTEESTPFTIGFQIPYTIKGEEEEKCFETSFYIHKVVGIRRSTTPLSTSELKKVEKVYPEMKSSFFSFISLWAL